MIGKISRIITLLIVGIGYAKNAAILCADVNHSNDSLRTELSKNIRHNDSTLNFCRALFETKYLNNPTEAKNDKTLNGCRNELKNSNIVIANLRKQITECVDSLVMDSSPFEFNPNKSFELKYARYQFGFAWKFGKIDTSGYYVLRVQRDGNIVNEIRTKRYCKNHSNLTPVELKELADSIVSNDISNLPKRYIENEPDGGILIFSIIQENHEKKIITMNYRPKEISNVLKLIESRNYEEGCSEYFDKNELFDDGKKLWRHMYAQ